jgi:hypothetical protein
MHVRSRALHVSVVLPIALGLALLSVSPALAHADIRIHPHTGPAGTVLNVQGSDFKRTPCPVFVDFFDANGGFFTLGSTQTSPTGRFRLTTQIPAGAALGGGEVRAFQRFYHLGECMPGGPAERARFIVTP